MSALFGNDFGPMMPAIERRTLEQRKVGATIVQSLSYDVEQDVIRDQLLHRLTARVLTDRITEDVFTGSTASEWPATTWQMFKHTHTSSWWLGWLVKRRPVAMTVDQQIVDIAVERCLTYPESTIALRDLGRPVIFETARRVRP